MGEEKTLISTTISVFFIVFSKKESHVLTKKSFKFHIEKFEIFILREFYTYLLTFLR